MTSSVRTTVTAADGARRRASFLVALTVTAIVAASLVVGADPTQTSAAPGESQVPTDNPDLPKACGIDIHVVLDESGSVRDYRRDVQTAFRAFTSALRNTGSRLAVSEFSTVARLPLSGPARYTFTPVTDQTIADTFEPYIASGYNPNGSTNWEDGFRVPRYLNEMRRANSGGPAVADVDPDLVVFITDGNPNKVIRHDRVTYDPGNPSSTANEYENKVPLSDNETTNDGENSAANRAVANSNGLKTQGAHILTIAVGAGLSGASTLDRLIRISGPDVFDGTGTFDISTDDVYKETDFSKLQDALRAAAFQLCAPSITVRKLVDLTPDTGVGDAIPGPGVDITASNIAPAPSTWVQPTAAPGTTAVTDTTDGNGFVNFQWNTATPTASQVTITEQDPATGPIPDLVYRPDLTTCTYRTPDQPNDTPLAINPVAFGFDTTVPQDAIVTCTIYNVLPAAPDIDLEKATNGFDADVAPGPSIPAGSPVTWTYVVTNTGTVTLTNVGVTDVPAATITCPRTTLAPNESMTCTATGTAVLGQYTNTATATGTPPTGPNVTDIDPSHYFGSAPGIDVEKATNGEDADAAPGPYVPVGDPVTWTYVVTNTGNVTLTNVDVSDVPAPTGGISCPTTTLAPNESMTCTATGTAALGQYENLATATGTSPSGPVADTDLSHYFGADPSIDIEKLTNGEDADTPTGPAMPVGSNVLWIYRVTNTGNVLLPIWDVTDNVQGVTVGCPRIPLRPGDTATCFATGTAVAGQYSNIGTVTAPDPTGGTPLTDSDPSHYFGVNPSIDVEKSTNGDDADTPTGPYVPVGDPVSWEYVITNTGNVALSGVDLFDTQLGPIACPTSSLAVGASTTCTANGAAVAGQYSNTAYVRAVDTLVGIPVFDDDPSHYFGADPGIVVEKATNGIDGDEPIAPDGSLNGPYILVGDPIVWSYRVTNAGNVTVTGITLVDDRLGAITCPQTSLDPGESMDCTERTGIAQRTDTAPYVNIATVTGQAGQSTVTDTDPSHYWGYEPGITIEKSTNGIDADTPTGPYVPVGDPVQWTYVVTNTGNVSIIDFTVTDSDPAVNIACPLVALILPGQSVTCRAVGTARPGQYENTATVEALDFFEDPVSDTDPSHYFGAAPSIDIEKSTNGIDADRAPGPFITEGELVTWRYVVTNTGNVDLVDVRVTDDRIGAIVCPSTTLAVGATLTCTAEGTAVIGQYANVGTASGVPAVGLQTRVTDTDPSHYNGQSVLPPVTTTPPPTTLPPGTLPPGTLPQTGSNGLRTLLTLGAFSALAGLGLLIARRARRPRPTA